MDTVRQFYLDFSSDSSMRERARKFNEEYKGATLDEAAIAAEIVTFAKSEGYEFTEEELKAYTIDTANELPDEELTAVAGGEFNENDCICHVGGSGSNNITDIACVCALPGLALLALIKANVPRCSVIFQAL